MRTVEFIWWATEHLTIFYSDAKPGEPFITNPAFAHTIRHRTTFNLQLFWDVAAVASVLLYLSSFHKKKAMPSMRQGISDFKEVRNMSEKSWGTNGLMPTPPPAGCCPNPGVFWGISPNVGSRRQFFPARSHQFLSEGSPSNVLPFCCAVTCVISQFIALWAGSFYHERFLSASFTLCSFAPTVVLSPLCSALFAAAEVLWQDHSGDTMWSQFTRLINPPPHL